MTEPTSKMTEWDELDLPVLTEIAEYHDSAEHAVPELSLEGALGLAPTPADSLHPPALSQQPTVTASIPELELELPPDLELDSLLMDGEGASSVPSPEFSLDHLPSLDLEVAEPEDMRLDTFLPKVPPGGLSQIPIPNAYPGEPDAFVFDLAPECGGEGEPGPSDDSMPAVNMRHPFEDEGAMAVLEPLSSEVAPPLAGGLAPFGPEQPLWEALPQDENWEVAPPPGGHTHGEAPLAGEFETADLSPHDEIHPADWSMEAAPERSGAAVEGKAGWGAEPPASSVSQSVFPTAIDMPVPEALPVPDVASAHGEAPYPDGDLHFSGAVQETTDGAVGSTLGEASVPLQMSSVQMGDAAYSTPSMPAESSLGQVASEPEPIIPELDLSALLGVMDEAHDLDVGEPDGAVAFSPVDEMHSRFDLDEPANATFPEPAFKPEQVAEPIEHDLVGESIVSVESSQPSADEEHLLESVHVAEVQARPEARTPVEPEPISALPELDAEVEVPSSGSQAAPSVEDQISTDETPAPVPDALSEADVPDLPAGTSLTIDKPALTEPLLSDDLPEAQGSVLPFQAEELRHQEEVNFKALPHGEPFASPDEEAGVPAARDGLSEEALSNEAWSEQELLNESDVVAPPVGEDILSANAEPEWKEPHAQPAGGQECAQDDSVLTPEAAAAPALVVQPVQSIDIDSLPQGVLHAPEMPSTFEAEPDPLAALQARLNEIHAQLDQSASEPAVFRMPPQREAASLHEGEKSPVAATPMNEPVHPPAWPASAIAEAESFPEESFPDLASAGAESTALQANTGVAVIGEEKLIESLYQKILPRMKVELGLWLQDALELQSKQLLAGVMQQLKEDYEPMFGETLRESLRQAISEAGGGDAAGYAKGGSE